MRGLLHMVGAATIAVPLISGAAHAATGTMRVGGLVRAIDASRHSITIFSTSAGRLYILEVQPDTRITLSHYAAGYADLLPGDHLLAIGAADTSRPASGQTAVLARIIRIGSPSFGGVVTAVAAAPGGAAMLTVRGRHGHLLRIDAPAQALVYTAGADGKPTQTARATDLVVGEHIGARGTRIGKFELAASAIHVYPHQHTIGGLVIARVPGQPPIYRIRASSGEQSLIQTTPRTLYTLNGRPASATIVALGSHIRVHGSNALRQPHRGVLVLIASRISLTAHRHTPHAHRARNTHAGASPSPTPRPGNPAPTPHAGVGWSPTP